MRIRRVVFVALLATFLMGVSAIPAHAALLIQTENVNLGVANAYLQTLQFNSFNPAIYGTLNSMTISFDGTATTTGHRSATRDQAGLAFSATWNLLLMLDVFGPPLNAAATYTALNASNSCGFDAAGPAVCGGNYSESANPSGTPAVDTWQVTPPAGATFGMTLSLYNLSTPGTQVNVASTTWNQTGDSFVGKMTVTYDYTPFQTETPEPGTLALLGAGIGIFAFLKRRS